MRTALATVLVVLAAAPAPAAGRPNILLVIADDLGPQVGCYGDRAARTPHIDALAAAGTRFTHAFASVSSCSPSRATLLTGRPTHQSGQYGLAHGYNNAHTFTTIKSLPGLLKPAGYRSGVLAKLHVLPPAVYPFDAEIKDPGRDPVGVAEKARAFIAGDPGPFFLVVGFTDPHRAGKGFANDQAYPPGVPAAGFDPAGLPVPGHLPDLPEVRADLADYYQSVARLDHGVGLLMKVLDDTKTADNTLVIFLSDNGIPFPGAKTTLYDPGVRLPLVVRRPGQTPGVSAAMVSWTDVAPTVLDWAGVRPPVKLPGRSFLGQLDGAPAAGWDVVYGSYQYHEVTMYYPMRMARTRTHKLILNLAHPLEFPHASDLWNSPSWQAVLKRGTPQLGARTTAAFLHRPAEELYDLSADPDEARNVAADPGYAAVRDDLRAKLRAWRRATDDPWLVKDVHE